MIGCGRWCCRARSAPSLMWAMMISVLMAGTSASWRLAIVPLVLDEIAGLEHFADVVEIGPHADQQATGPDAFGGRFGDRGHVDRMVVRARRTADQFLQQRMGDVADFQQADVGQHAEQSFR